MWLNYKGVELFVGCGICPPLDKNINGTVNYWCDEHLGGCGKTFNWMIEKGKLIINMKQILDEDDKEFLEAMIREYGLKMIKFSRFDVRRWEGEILTNKECEELSQRGLRCLKLIEGIKNIPT